MAKPRVAVSKWIKPYNKDGSSNLQFCKNKCGVYLIREDGELKYVGFSGGTLQKTMMRHFQRWSDNKQVRVTFHDRMECTVRVIFCRTPLQAARLEEALIFRYSPPDNPRQMKGHAKQYEIPILDEYDDWAKKPMSVADMEEAPF